jgi:hypothetical protein
MGLHQNTLVAGLMNEKTEVDFTGCVINFQRTFQALEFWDLNMTPNGMEIPHTSA